ncbi:hypothetical protein POMI540_0823 [Schizosaccharomyces pombe]
MDSGTSVVSISADILRPPVLTAAQTFGDNENECRVRLVLTAQQVQEWNLLPQDIQQEILKNGQVRVETYSSSNTARKIFICTSSVSNLASSIPALIKVVTPTKEEDASLKINLAVSSLILGSKVLIHQNLIPSLFSVSNSTKLLYSASLLPRSSERLVTLETNEIDASVVIETLLKYILSRISFIPRVSVVPYIPDAAYGIYGSPSTFTQFNHMSSMVTPENPYGIPPIALTSAGGNPDPLRTTQVFPHSGPSIPLNIAATQVVSQKMSVPSSLLDQLYHAMPHKLMEISQNTNANITVEESDSNSNEKFISVVGTSEANQSALMQLYAALESLGRK